VSNLAQDLKRWKVRGFRPIDGAPLEVRLSFKDVLVMLWRFPPVWATLFYRASYWCTSHGIRLLPSIFERLNMLLFGLEMSSGMAVGPGLYIPHPRGMVLVARRIGANCSFIHACTLGMRETWEFPAVGDAVFVGAGARVLGGIMLGDGCSVGANAVVIKDVPPGATAVGVPARIREAARPEAVPVA
jgi:serine O-acetyltransferase